MAHGPQLLATKGIRARPRGDLETRLPATVVTKLVLTMAENGR